MLPKRWTDAITALVWEPASVYLASAGGSDRHIRLWHNAPGKRELIKELQAKIPKTTSEPLKVGMLCVFVYFVHRPRVLIRRVEI